MIFRLDACASYLTTRCGWWSVGWCGWWWLVARACHPGLRVMHDPTIQSIDLASVGGCEPNRFQTKKVGAARAQPFIPAYSEGCIIHDCVCVLAGTKYRELSCWNHVCPNFVSWLNFYNTHRCNVSINSADRKNKSAGYSQTPTCNPAVGSLKRPKVLLFDAWRMKFGL